MLLQENMRLDNFTHHEHEVTIQLGTVANRHCNHRWYCWMWKLSLATQEGSQGPTRIPHGLLIDNAYVSDFVRSSEELMLKFASPQFSPTNHDNYNATLQVKIVVFLVLHH